MKKYVLSAVVTSLFVPMAYAMDGAAPAVEVEVPAVEITAVEDLPVDDAVIEPIVVEAVDVLEDVDVGVRTLEVQVEVDVELKPEVCPGIDEAVLVGPPVDENGEPIEVNHFGGMLDKGEVFDENGVPVESIGGTFDSLGLIYHPVEGEAVDPNMIDLASQSGIKLGDTGEPVVFQTFGNGGGEAEVTSVDDAPIRSHGEIQPNFRGGITDRGAEALAASSSAVVATDDSDTPNAQLLNDEQRGAVRGLRSEEESAKPRAGLGKLMAKFRKPKSHVTLASGTADLALSSKLAEVDRMRDTALRTGDQKALAKADKLEKELRAKSGKVTKISTRTK